MRSSFLIPFFALPFLLLSGCGAQGVSYEIELDTEDPERTSELILASMRVVERRLESMGEEAEGLDIRTDDGKSRIVLELSNADVEKILSEDLQEPFKMRVMEQAEDESDADIVVDGHGGFNETGITEAHMDWLAAAEDTTPGRGRVTIYFTEEGRDLMQDVFQKNHEKFIGIFVRDQLVSKLLVDTDRLLDDIVITDIPTVDLAKVFADDMNVGIHVRYKKVE